MRHLFPLCHRSACAILTLALLPLAAARGEVDAPTVDVDFVLKSLKQIEEKNSSSSKATLQKAISDFNSAATANGRAMEFFEQATRATVFAGQNLQQTQYQEWKKKEADKLKSQDMQEAARLHLFYLSLTLQFASKTPVNQLVPALTQYTEQVFNTHADFSKQDLMKRSLNDSIFVRWYGLSHYLSGLKDWEMTPGNADAMWDKLILPELRKSKDRRVIQYWDQRIERETKNLGDTKREFTLEQFTQVQKPTLLWRRAEDLNTVGLRNHAINEMLALIKNHPAHPENAAWITKLTALLTPPVPKEAKAAPSTASTE